MIFPMQLSSQMVTGIGLLAGALTTISFVPQLVRVYMTRSADDLSYGYLATFAAGIVLWEIYGLLLRSLPVILTNAVSLVLVLGIIILKSHYQRNHKRG